MKKKIVMLLCMAVCMMAAGCSGPVKSAVKEKIKENAAAEQSAEENDTIHYVKDYGFVVKAKDSWTEDEDRGAFELRLYNEKEELYFHVMSYKNIDLAEGMDGEYIQNLQMEDLISKRENAKEIEPVTKIEYDDKTVYASLYSAERDGYKNYYYSFGVELSDAEVTLWVLANGMPSDLLENRAEIEKMVEEIVAVGEKNAADGNSREESRRAVKRCFVIGRALC